MDVKCPECHYKTIAKLINGKLYVWCKTCKKQVEVRLEGEESHEPERFAAVERDGSQSKDS